ncbi:hypothetical protein Lalb_Chr14g0363491 [Lupinus albus]|uniref:Uncharacterized protein n=1 Tax=Lupinus albus TaxID=3870 RepID=A0A6A4PEH5_LUPAL|nr:hypothetical protein Lalb_Chr14g0363491 [Lupinus albus]
MTSLDIPSRQGTSTGGSKLIQGLSTESTCPMHMLGSPDPPPKNIFHQRVQAHSRHIYEVHLPCAPVRPTRSTTKE